MASFVLHGAAMAGFHSHKSSAAQCQPGAAHDHKDKAHHHGDGIVHIHAEQATGAAGHDHGGKDDGQASSDGPCCSSICSVTLAVPGTDLVSAPMRLARTLQFQSQVGSGIERDGLKRPPRTPSIA